MTPRSAAERGPGTVASLTASERFWARVEPDPSSGCLIWLGTQLRGYGRFALTASRNVYAHRFAYEDQVGPIPEGLTLDHLCRNKGCVNPAHLDPVTGRVNTLRSDNIAARCARQTHCINGHLLQGENVIHPAAHPTHRVCRACNRGHWREYKRRVRARLSADEEGGTT